MGLKWSDNLLIGNTEIDNQHKELFKRVNALIEAIHQKKGAAEVGPIVKFIEDYVIAHFSAEERVMTAAKYPKLSAHKLQHEEFKKKFMVIKKLFNEKGATVDVLVQVHGQLGNWLLTHIPTFDKEMSVCVQASRPAQSAWGLRAAV